MNKKLYKKQLKKMDYDELLFESKCLRGEILYLDDLKRKYQHNNDIYSLCNVMNKRSEFYEKLRIVDDEVESRQKEE